MVTRLELFKKEMEPAEKLYSQELIKFSKRYDVLGKMILTEEPDIDTQEYIYFFEKLNNPTPKQIEETYLEIFKHMREFSKENKIEEFSQYVRIW